MTPKPPAPKSLAMVNIAKWQERDMRRQSLEAQKRAEQVMRRAEHEAFRARVRADTQYPFLTQTG